MKGELGKTHLSERRRGRKKRSDSFQGSIFYREGRYDEAIDAFETARELAPDDEAVLFNLGLSYLKRAEQTKSPSDFEAAKRLFRSVSKLAPSSPHRKQLEELIASIEERTRSEVTRKPTGEIEPAVAAPKLPDSNKPASVAPESSTGQNRILPRGSPPSISPVRPIDMNLAKPVGSPSRQPHSKVRSAGIGLIIGGGGLAVGGAVVLVYGGLRFQHLAAHGEDATDVQDYLNQTQRASSERIGGGVCLGLGAIIAGLGAILASRHAQSKTSILEAPATNGLYAGGAF